MNFNNLRQLFSFIKNLSDGVPTQNTSLSSHDSEIIQIRIMGFDNAINQFRLKKSTPLRKLMIVYSELIDIPKENIRFRIDGQATSDTDTPTSLGIEDGDTTHIKKI